MAKASRTRGINNLYQFIYSLKNKCDSINDVNKDLILQYCRFTIMSNEVSKEIQDGLGVKKPEELATLIGLYKEFNKIAIALYKTLKFDSIKEELKADKNPYFELLEDARKNGSD